MNSMRSHRRILIANQSLRASGRFLGGLFLRVARDLDNAAGLAPGKVVEGPEGVGEDNDVEEGAKEEVDKEATEVLDSFFETARLPDDYEDVVE